MKRRLILSVICLTHVLTNEAASDTNYRLNTPIKPSEYSILITPYFETGDSDAFTFDGEVIINFRTESNTDQIKFHSQDLKFNETNIKVTQGSTVLALKSENALEFNEKYTFAYLNLQNELVPETDYVMRIVYKGPIREDLNGFYRNYYKENGVKKWLGATQMEPTHARKVFPCFDEPDLKATFKLMIDRPADFKPSLANTKMLTSENLQNSRTREIFYPTPIMSTYLVAFLVSEFEAIDITENGDLGIYARPDARNQSTYAFDFAKRVEKALSEFFGIDYYSTNPYLKLDHVALPDFRAGAMENWGLVKYRESLLLYVPEESTPYFKYRVSQIVAHETTHMWFGNLVTCHWWSNTWLNEGFANYFQDYITAQVEPDVNSRDMLVIGSVYTAYNADETPKAPAITNNEVNSPEEISEHFGAFSYQKGGAVIRMIHNLIGDDAFKKALNKYLTKNEFKSGYPQLFFEAVLEGVNASNTWSAYPGSVDADDIMSSWISQPGHPLLQVDIDYEEETVSLSQKRFYTDASISSEEIYKIPLTYTTEMSPNFEDTSAAYIMDTKTYEFELPGIGQNHSWVIFNVQEVGFYRVNYDLHTWSIISSALKSDKRETIHYINRAKIVNDLFALLYAEEVEFDLLYDVLEFLEHETEYAVWFAAISGFSKLRYRYLATEAVADIDGYILDVMQNIIASLGYDVKPNDSFVTLRNRMLVLDFACNLGHEGCVESIKAMYKSFKENGTYISPSLRPTAYCVGLRYGDESDYEFLWHRMESTNVANEARIIGEALGCSNNEASLRRFLVSMTEEDSPIRTQDLAVPLESVLLDYSHLPVVMDELKNNLIQWNSIYKSLDTVLTTVAAALHTQEDFNSVLLVCYLY